MNEYDSIETAYRNGYKAGLEAAKEAIKKEIRSREQVIDGMCEAFDVVRLEISKNEIS